MTDNTKLELVSKNIRSYNDFPKPGIIFRDIFSVFANPKACDALMSLIFDHIEPMKGKVSAVCALESRGFLFGPQVAAYLRIPFVPIRKQGKLPGKVQQVMYELEYGTDMFEIQTESVPCGTSVLLMDDLLATGGSLAAACKLINSNGSQVYECFVIMELTELNGRENVPVPIHSILQF